MIPDPEIAARKAIGFFREGYNCSQSVLMAFSGYLAIDEKTLAGYMSGFGGGMGRIREVCGAFSAMVFISGSIIPSKDPSDRAAKTSNYALVQEFARSFRDVNGGSIVCRELLGIGSCPESPAPSERNAEYYRKRPCEQIVGNAARIVAEKLSSLTIN